jgi:hypothetical protein
MERDRRRDVLEGSEDLYGQRLALRRDHDGEPGSPSVGGLDHLESGKGALELAEERPRVRERDAPVKVEIEGLAMSELLERDHRGPSPIALGDQSGTAGGDRRDRLAKQAVALFRAHRPDCADLLHALRAN